MDLSLRDSRTILDLCGDWEIEPGGASAPTRFNHTIQVPSLVDCANEPYEWTDFDFHWYRKVIPVDESYAGKSAFLRIEQSMFGAAVWVNGRLAGESISCYTSQEYRVESFLNSGKANEILVRVGQRSNLPPESAVGKDQERLSFIPGIWGDVELILCGSLRVKVIRTLPRIAESCVDVDVWIENLCKESRDAVVSGKVFEKKGGSSASPIMETSISLAASSETCVRLRVPIVNAKLWSPDSPFLYEFTAILRETNGEILDEYRVHFGMREFSIIGPDFYLNGQKILLRGSNIAFHRFLSDQDRKLLPWNTGWIEKVLVEIPKAHNFNFFRAHLGHMYNRWYDIADEGGILLQDEWQFWGATGTREQITKEFSDWLKDNWNHPSIVIWDALNESSDNMVQNEIIPEMKELDPTRPWESRDLVEDHPYIYSLGPVLVNRKFGYTRSLEEIENSTFPSQVNEYLWWWLDKDFKPSELTRKVVSRWLGSDASETDLIDHQSFLATELTELFRRMEVRCIQPFVYLSANEGPTSHWYAGDIADLNPKPVLAALRNAFEPFGVSVEMWDRHFHEREARTVRLHIFNDYPEPSTGIVRFGVTDFEGRWVAHDDFSVSVEPTATAVKTVRMTLPEKAGDYFVRAELMNPRTRRFSVSRKVAHVYPGSLRSETLQKVRVGLVGPPGDIGMFLQSRGLSVFQIDNLPLDTADIVVVIGAGISSTSFQQQRARVFKWVEEGGKIAFIEPEKNVQAPARFELPGNRDLTIVPREDRDQGGYDSYVIASDHAHPIWRGIRKVDLKMFNGGYGGEVVPQSDLLFGGSHEVLARSGLNLARPAVINAPAGRGSIVVSSLEIGGRLLPHEGCYDNPYALRPDPIACKFLLNMIAFLSDGRFEGSSESTAARINLQKKK